MNTLNNCECQVCGSKLLTVDRLLLHNVWCRQALDLRMGAVRSQVTIDCPSMGNIKGDKVIDESSRRFGVCFYCGQAFPVRTLLQHLLDCFNRPESNATQNNRLEAVSSEAATGSSSMEVIEQKKVTEKCSRRSGMCFNCDESFPIQTLLQHLLECFNRRENNAPIKDHRSEGVSSKASTESPSMKVFEQPQRQLLFKPYCTDNFHGPESRFSPKQKAFEGYGVIDRTTTPLRQATANVISGGMSNCEINMPSSISSMKKRFESTSTMMEGFTEGLLENVQFAEELDGTGLNAGQQAEPTELPCKGFKRVGRIDLPECVQLNESSNKKYYCTVCCRSFDTKRQGLYHEYCQNPSKKKPFPCSLCSKAFITKSHLMYHSVVHKGTPSHKCVSCPKSYNHRAKLMRHVRFAHGNLRSYVCNFCEKIYSTPCSLKVHEKTHAKKKENCRTFQCAECPKAYDERRKLMRHVRISHEGSELRVCHICERTFKTAWSLKVHMSTHSKHRSRSFRCDALNCDKAFHLQKDLKRHIQSVHRKEKPFKCEKCQAAYSRKDNLARHVKINHKPTTTELQSDVGQDLPFTIVQTYSCSN